jgi:hypothetical protein
MSTTDLIDVLAGGGPVLRGVVGGLETSLVEDGDHWAGGGGHLGISGGGEMLGAGTARCEARFCLFFHHGFSLQPET